MSRCGKPEGRRPIRHSAPAAALACALLACGPACADPPASDFWLGYGKSVRLCPDAHAAVPVKLEGATWGVLASGVLSCRDLGTTYRLKVVYLNVFVDPNDHAMLTQASLHFDWLGLALYRRVGTSREVDWLFDEVRPVKAELGRDASGRFVLGDLSFSVPKRKGEMATNMLFYLTFGGPLVAIDAR